MNGLWFNFAFLGCIGLYFFLIWAIEHIGRKHKIIDKPSEDHSKYRYPGR
jgi:hypothetical protein